MTQSLDCFVTEEGLRERYRERIYIYIGVTCKYFFQYIIDNKYTIL